MVIIGVQKNPPGSPERVPLRIAFVDDDESLLEYHLIREEKEGWDASGFNNIFEAQKKSADVYVLDITSVSGPCRMEVSFKPIDSLLSDHPNSIVIISTSMPGRFAETLVEEIQKYRSENRGRIFYGGPPDWVNVLGKIREIGWC